MVVTVLRSGGDYDERWIRALRRGLDECAPGTALVCLTDMDVSCDGVDVRPLYHEWPGWWSKIEAFRPDIEGQVLLVDLDTLPVGDMTGLLGYDREFALIRNLGRCKRSRQSGVVAFRAGKGTQAASIYQRFEGAADTWMESYRGDGEWLDAHAGKADIIQELYPGAIVSFKWECRSARPGGPALVLGHGQPRFSAPKAGWAHRLWMERAA